MKVYEKNGGRLKENYPYRYEIVSRKEILEENSKYSDSSIYKYAVLSFMEQIKRTTTTTVINTDNYGNQTKTSVSPGIIQTLNNFHFYDRTSGKNYPGSELPSSNVKQEFTEFVKTINRAK